MHSEYLPKCNLNCFICGGRGGSQQIDAKQLLNYLYLVVLNVSDVFKNYLSTLGSVNLGKF